MFKLYPSSDGLVIEQDGRWLRPHSRIDWDAVFTQDDPLGFVRSAAASADALSGAPDSGGTPLLTSQEVWAAGVTYLRSRTARMEESKDAGGGSFYDKVYVADRPELFFKSTRSRIAAPGAPVRIRGDSTWNVPEPELTLAITARGRIFGYTIGNDMSSRDIEGENPLYLPQAKVYAGSASMGPCLLVTDTPPDRDTTIQLEIVREGAPAFQGSTAISQIKRPLESLVEYLFRDNVFPDGCYLMTGTGIVPPDHFSLRSGDEVRITIAPIGTLVNLVA